LQATINSGIAPALTTVSLAKNQRSYYYADSN